MLLQGGDEGAGAVFGALGNILLFGAFVLFVVVVICLIFWWAFKDDAGYVPHSKGLDNGS